MSTVGEKLIEARVRANLTLREANEASGVSRTTISLLERGLQDPRDLTLGKLARAYGVTLEELRETPLGRARRAIPYDPDALIERVLRTHGSRTQREINAAYQEARKQELAGLSPEELRQLLDDLEEALEEIPRVRGTREEINRPENAERTLARVDLLEARLAVVLQLQAVAPKEHA